MAIGGDSPFPRQGFIGPSDETVRSLHLSTATGTSNDRPASSGRTVAISQARCNTPSSPGAQNSPLNFHLAIRCQPDAGCIEQ